ncbi:hypothetical protein [Alicyclobacillus sp. SO9]|uniref:hypothetical protein n=1 Tax=Alicyclobacillus sp. SO9 TaxID=2665646 RepID=UPI0018E8CEAA|nr:hypothetical protein [Alicyclobacillus sp. SO9]QQE77759.1 hypothetical protein GI364_17755 [Alicyclobacillus sp. SO9]
MKTTDNSLPLLMELSPEVFTMESTESMHYRYNYERQLNVMIDSGEAAVSITSMGTKTLTETAEPTDDDDQRSIPRALGTETFTKTFEETDSDSDFTQYLGMKKGTYTGSGTSDSER